MSQLKFILYIFCLIILAGACQPQGNEVKVGFLFHAFDVPRWEQEKKYFEAKIKELGGTAIIKVADKNDVLQRQQAEELIEEGVELIVMIAVNDPTGAGIVRMAHESGVKVMSYDGLLQNCPLDYFVSFDANYMGNALGKFLTDKAPGGKYVIVNGDKRHLISTQLYNGIMEHFQPFIDEKKVEIIYNSYTEDWAPANAAYNAERALEFSDTKIDAFLCVNDGTAGAVINVLKNRGLLEQTIVTGGDAELAACWRIMNNEQDMTVYKSSKAIAEGCAELAIDIANGKKIEGLTMINNGRQEVKSLIIKPTVVTKENMESTIVADGTYTMEQINSYSHN